MKDDNNEQISEVYNYYSPEDTNKTNEFKFVIIGTIEMWNNLSYNIKINFIWTLLIQRYLPGFTNLN